MVSFCKTFVTESLTKIDKNFETSICSLRVSDQKRSQDRGYDLRPTCDSLIFILSLIVDIV